MVDLTPPPPPPSGDDNLTSAQVSATAIVPDDGWGEDDIGEIGFCVIDGDPFISPIDGGEVEGRLPHFARFRVPGQRLPAEPRVGPKGGSSVILPVGGSHFEHDSIGEFPPSVEIDFRIETEVGVTIQPLGLSARFNIGSLGCFVHDVAGGDLGKAELNIPVHRHRAQGETLITRHEKKNEGGTEESRR